MEACPDASPPKTQERRRSLQHPPLSWKHLLSEQVSHTTGFFHGAAAPIKVEHPVLVARGNLLASSYFQVIAKRMFLEKGISTKVVLFHICSIRFKGISEHDCIISICKDLFLFSVRQLSPSASFPAALF